MKQRIITGVILALVVFFGILFLPPLYFSIALLGVGVIAFSEWAVMLDITGIAERIYIAFGSLILLITSIFGLAYLNHNIAISFILPVATLWLCMPLMLNLHIKEKSSLLKNEIFLLFFSVISVVAFLVSLLILQSVNRYLVLYLVLLIAAADSAAYFAGRQFGKHKLAYSISPGKTIEGALGGLAVSLIFTLICFSFTDYSFKEILFFLVLNIIIVPISVSGDLFESVIKRQRGLKDSGNILPGHGGVLDRIDALTAAAPVFLVGLSMASVI